MMLMYGTLPHHMVIKQGILYVSLLMNWSLNIKTFLYNDKWTLLQTVTYLLHRGYFDVIISTYQTNHIMIKLGTQVQHKLHDDINGDVVQLNRRSNTATVKFWNYQDEMMLASVYLSDLEVA